MLKWLEQKVGIVRIVEIRIDVVLIASAPDKGATHRRAKAKVVLLQLDVDLRARRRRPLSASCAGPLR